MLNFHQRQSIFIKVIEAGASVPTCALKVPLSTCLPAAKIFFVDQLLTYCAVLCVLIILIFSSWRVLVLADSFVRLDRRIRIISFLHKIGERNVTQNPSRTLRGGGATDGPLGADRPRKKLTTAPSLLTCGVYFKPKSLRDLPPRPATKVKTPGPRLRVGVSRKFILPHRQLTRA